MYMAKKIELIKGKSSTKSFFAFTLSEVLLTIGIIGVIAALTIPIIVNKIDTIQRNTQVEKMYSLVNNALYAIKADNSGTLLGLFPDATTAMNLLAGQLKYSKLCNNVVSDGCMPSGTIKYLKGGGSWNYSNSAAIVLNTGNIIWIYKDFATNGWAQCNSTDIISQPYCFMLEIDINGSKQPNQLGVDVFEFFVTKDLLTPQTPQTRIYANNDCDNSLAASTGAMCGYYILTGKDY